MSSRGNWKMASTNTYSKRWPWSNHRAVSTQRCHVTNTVHVKCVMCGWEIKLPASIWPLTEGTVIKDIPDCPYKYDVGVSYDYCSS